MLKFGKNVRQYPEMPTFWGKNKEKRTFLKKNEKKMGKSLVESKNVSTFATAYEK